MGKDFTSLALANRFFRVPEITHTLPLAMSTTHIYRHISIPIYMYLLCFSRSIYRFLSLSICKYRYTCMLRQLYMPQYLKIYRRRSIRADAGGVSPVQFSTTSPKHIVSTPFVSFGDMSARHSMFHRGTRSSTTSPVAPAESSKDGSTTRSSSQSSSLPRCRIALAPAAVCRRKRCT